MLVNAQIKSIQSLDHKKFRDAHGAFVAEGPKIVSEMMAAANLELISCYAEAGWLRENAETGKRASLCVEITPRELERISFLQTPNRVLAVLRKPTFDLPATAPGLTLLREDILD